MSRPFRLGGHWVLRDFRFGQVFDMGHLCPIGGGGIQV